VVDLEAPHSWPPEVRDRLEGFAQRLSGRPGFRPADVYANDLSFGLHTDLDLEAEIRAHLASELVLMYHGTRLLPHEVDTIRADGLRLLTDDLRRDKVDGARTHYPELLSQVEAELLLASGPLSWGIHHQVRRGELCVVAPLSIIAGEEGMRPLLEDWGGESLAWAAHDRDQAGIDCGRAIRALSKASLPSIIEVAIRGSELPATTDLWRVMVGSILVCNEPWNEWHLHTAISRQDIVDILQPGHLRWSDSYAVIR
jgi:hypothetical protein